MKLFACVNAYREERLLADCLASIRTYAPAAEIVVVDGAYESWTKAARRLAASELEAGHEELYQLIMEFAKPDSQDNTLKICEEFGVEHVIRTDKPWPHEYTKRSQYFIGEPGDWYLVIDGDERLTGPGRVDWPLLNGLKAPWVYNVIIERDDDSVPYPMLRLQRHHSEGMVYLGAHHALHTGSKLWKKEELSTVGEISFDSFCTLSGEERLRLEPFWIRHLYMERAKDHIRNMVRGAYYRHLTGVEEQEFRHANDL